MAKIGSFGDVVFSVSDRTVKTFNEMSWKFGANYATHDRHLQEDLLEFLGPTPDSISFTMVFSVFRGVKPYKEVKRLREMVKNGEAGRLVIGGKVYGSYKWVATDGTAELERYDNKGNLWAATVKMTLQEYAKR